MGRVREIVDEILHLPPAEQSEVIRELVRQLDDRRAGDDEPAEAELDRWWGEEIERRIDAADRSGEPPITWPQLRAELQRDVVRKSRP